MSITTLTNWQNSFADIPLVTDQTWKTNWADWIAQNVNQMKLAGWSPGTNITFNWNKALFVSSLPDSSPAIDARIGLASAYETAILASSLVITPPNASPPLDAVTAVIVDPASVVTGKAYILATDISTVTADAKNAKIVVEMRKAFAALKYTVTGTTGGNPVTYSLQGVI